MTIQSVAPCFDLNHALGRIATYWRRGARDRLDTLRFLGAWLRNPVRAAAIAPSGRVLSALITQEIDGRSGAIIELGGGTGVFTAALIARGVAESDVTVIEQDPIFAALLTQRFPRSTVLAIDATDLNHVDAPHFLVFGAAVCGLGLLNMPAEQVEAILRTTFSRLHAHGAFYLFTYGRQCSVPAAVLERLGLEAHHVGRTLRNLPPASVFCIARRGDDLRVSALPAE